MVSRTVSGSPRQTAAIASSLARLLSAGDIVFLHGPLGAGKTTFIRAAARELGVSVPVTSPSYILARSYRGTVTVHHLDLYRLSSYGQGEEADLQPYFSPDAVTFVEWPEALEGIVSPTVSICLGHLARDSRSVEIRGSREMEKIL
jgi:tRNA threonylcarbamoyladenosine biosynthesis protein TsaE